MPLQLITGSMYSGKTTELVKRITRLKQIGMRCCVINHSYDTRTNGNFIQTHDGIALPALKTDDILLVRIKDYDAIAIDEAQFFHNLKTAVQLMLNENKYVIVAGLNGDFKQEPFGEIKDLISIADEITFKRALCTTCGNAASFTKRLDNNTAKIAVQSKYIAVCRKCYV